MFCLAGRGDLARYVILPSAESKFNGIALRADADYYLSFSCELSQKLVHVCKRVTFLQSIENGVDLVCVIQCPGAQSQLCHLDRGQ